MNFAALERIERRPKHKKNSGEPDEFDEEQGDVVAVANVILAIVPVGFGPAVYDFLRARTTTTASTLNLHALEETAATTSQPAQATRCKGLREEQAERGYFAALERIERRPKYKKKSGEPDEFDEEQADVVAVATPQEARPLVTAHASKDGALQEVCNEKNRHTPAAS